MSTHLAKRSRTDEAPKVLRKRALPWMEDGNLIIAAGDTEFRVMRSVMVKHSYVFHNMLALPQPLDAETHDGCPVVRLPESRLDLARVLGILFNAGITYVQSIQLTRTISYSIVTRHCSSYGSGHKVPFIELSAMIKFGTKYHIHHLRDNAIAMLKAIFSNDIDLFSNYYTVTDYPYATAASPFMDSVVSMQARDVIALIALAQTHKIPALLPPAFYICAQLDIRVLVNGNTDSDGRLWVLTQSNLQRCLAGQSRLRIMDIRSRDFIYLGRLASGCLSPAKCRQRLAERREKEHFDVFEYGLTTNPLLPSRWIKDLELCASCTQTNVAKYNVMRGKVWKKLDRTFELQPEHWKPVYHHMTFSDDGDDSDESMQSSDESMQSSDEQAV